MESPPNPQDPRKPRPADPHVPEMVAATSEAFYLGPEPTHITMVIHGLTVDGICGPKTQAKLKDAHGC